MIKKGYINGVFIFVVCYFSIAFLGRGIFHKEIFPFFHWSLYSNIPQNNDQLQLLLVSENDKEVEVVNLLSKTDKIFTTPIELNTVLEAYYSCYKSKCKEIRHNEVLLLSLLPDNCEIQVVKKQKQKTAIVAIIKNKKISYVQ